MKMRHLGVLYAIVIALGGPAIAETRTSNTLPAQFLGCYRDADWWNQSQARADESCRQPTEKEKGECPGGGILVASRMWTTFEDWTCDKFSVTKRGDGIVVDQICGGE